MVIDLQYIRNPVITSNLCNIKCQLQYISIKLGEGLIESLILCKQIQMGKKGIPTMHAYQSSKGVRATGKIYVTLRSREAKLQPADHIWALSAFVQSTN